MKSDVIKMNHNQIFDYMYVDDLLNILEWFINNNPKSHRYNVCTSKPVELLSLAKDIITIVGTDKKIIISNKEKAATYTGSNARLLGEIRGYNFLGHIEGIRDMVKFYADNDFK